MTSGALLGFTLLVPLAGAAAITLLRARPNARETASLVASGTLFAIVLRVYLAVSGGNRPELALAEPIPGISITLEAEPLGVLFALVASFLWIVTTMYSIGYMRGNRESNQTRFYLFFAFAIASAMGVAFAGNLFTLFVFYELLSLTTFPLVTHAGTAKARRAGRVYLGILLTTSIGLLLLAIAWTYAITGTLDFREGGILEGRAAGAVVPVLLGLYVFGIGKAAVMPLHRWLPAAMVAPTPVSALLHAVAVVKAGVFAVLKVTVYVFGIDFLAEAGASAWLTWVAAATIILGSLVAFTKDNLKARLAYSTVSQLSYVVLGAMLASSLGVVGGGMHIVTHAFGKITLFFCAGAIYVVAHKTEVSQMRGLGRTMPVTMTAFLVGALSVVGVPPLAGSVSKWYLLGATLDAGQIALAVVLLVSTLLNLAYLLPIPILAFFSKAEDETADGGPQGGKAISEAPAWCLIALSFAALGCIALFFWADHVYQLLQPIAAAAAAGG